MSDDATTGKDPQEPAKRRGLTSVLALYLLHALNIGLPIVTLPFLTRSLGSQLYGTYGLLLAWIGLATIAIEFGYGIRGTRLLAAQARADSALAAVLRRQLVHAALCLPVLALVLALMGGRDVPVGATSIVLTVLITLTSAVSPLWFFVARQRVGELLVPTLISKLAFLVLVAIVLPVYPSLELALAAVLVSFLWILIPLWEHRRSIVSSPALPLANAPTGDSWWAQSAIPIQRLGSALYTSLPILLVAAWFGLDAAGWYFLADRIVRGAVGLFTPLTSHLLPLQLRARQGTPDSTQLQGLRRMLLAVSAAASLAAVALVGLAPWLVVLLGGPSFTAAGTLLMWLAPITALSTVNALLINHLYGQAGETTIAVVVWLASASYLLSLFVVGRSSIEMFTALSMAVEAVILIGLWIAIRRAAL